MKICIVSPGYLSSTPRVVKEADALAAAGLDVRVVCTEGNLDYLRAYDAQLHASRSWRWSHVDWSPSRAGERALYWKSRLRTRIARSIEPLLRRWRPWSEMAEGFFSSELAPLAAAEQADLYIGHYPAGLIAAAQAAARWNSRLAYDAEDFHVGEDLVTASPSTRSQRIHTIEQRYLPACAYVSAASRRIGEALAERYGLSIPVVLHNVFSWSDRVSIDGRIKDRRGPGLSLYWFSQTIGEGRGLEDAIRAVGQLQGAVQLHLRGVISAGTERRFRSLADQSGAKERVFFHAPVAPEELLSRAAEHDIGLALEQPVSLNRKMAASNKLFMYLLAGLAVAATDMIGQRDILEPLGPASLLYSPGDIPALARGLQRWADSPETLSASKRASLAAAQERWNWEKESETLIRQVQKVCAV
jgi:glycosyltransferase involved in cell wall biosynthesis